VSERKEIHKTTFSRNSKKTAKPKSTIFTEYGYKPDGDGVPPEYLVRITSFRNNCTVVAVLQENIMTRVESRWEPFIPTSMLATGNLLIQAVTGGRRSLITKATSRRLWMGSTPMVLSLNLKFEAVTSPQLEVVEPCRLLQTMALPSEPSGQAGLTDFWTNLKKGVEEHGLLDPRAYDEALSKLPVLGPPGPTPFTTEGILNAERSWNELNETEVIEGMKGGDIIVVDLGKFLSFWNVIVKEVSTVHHIKFDPSGDPISANVNIVFETYEMMTRESLETAYQKVAMSPAPESVAGITSRDIYNSVSAGTAIA